MVGYGKGKRILITLPVTEQHRKLLEQEAGEAELICTQDRTEIEELAEAGRWSNWQCAASSVKHKLNF